jgi:hypothetical protein
MKQRMRRMFRGEGGFILPLVLALFAVGALLLGPMLGHGYTSIQAGTVTETKAEELLLQTGCRGRAALVAPGRGRGRPILDRRPADQPLIE